MRLALLVAVVVALVFSGGCEPRQPLTRAEVVGISDSLLRTYGLSWGDPVEVLMPETVDADGRRWWQIRYAPRPERTGDRRAPFLILVDDATNWARFPTPDYVERRQALRAGDPPLVTSAQVRPGTRILVLGEPAPDTPERSGVLAREAARLNGMAAASGLSPLFSVRRDRTGRSALIYGWQGDRGMTEDTAVTDWLAARTDHAARWIDLDAAP